MTTQNNRKTSRNLIDIVKDIIFQIFRLFSVIWGLFQPFLAMFWQNLAWNSKCHRRKSAISNHLHQISACLAIDLSGDMTNLWQLRVLGKILPKRPKKAPNDRKWSECLKNDILNHLHRISAHLAIVLSGHMTSLRQFWLWGQNWPKVAKNGRKGPQMTEHGLNI